MTVECPQRYSVWENDKGGKIFVDDSILGMKAETATFKDVVERTAFTSSLRTTIAAQLAAQ